MEGRFMIFDSSLSTYLFIPVPPDSEQDSLVFFRYLTYNLIHHRSIGGCGMKRAGIMFVFSGVIFCALTAITGKVAPFLPVGIALILIGIIAVRRFKQGQYQDQENQE